MFAQFKTQRGASKKDRQVTQCEIIKAERRIYSLHSLTHGLDPTVDMRPRMLEHVI